MWTFNWSYSPETAKYGLTSVILTLTISMDLNSVIGNTSSKFHDDEMMELAGNELRSLPESGHYYSPVPSEIMHAFSQTILSLSQIPKVYLW